MAMRTAFKPSRRNFLKTSGLVIGFTLPGAARLAQAAAPAEFKPNAYLRVGADDRVTVVVGLSEMGQGVHTAMPQLVAEELDADWTRVRVEQAPVDPAFKNPIFGSPATGGSTSVNGSWGPMRKAGAAAREMLVAAAAQTWKVDASECRTEKGAVVHKSGKKLSYGKLVAAASKQPVPKEPKLKDASEFKIIGQNLRRLDTPQKVNGSGKYGLDVRLPGMLTAALAQPPVPGGKAVSVDDSKAKQVKGVRQVIQIPQGVAVLADGYWQAKKGRDALQIQWDKGANAGLSSEGVTKMLTEATQQEGKVARNEGSVGSASGAKTLEAVYEAPYLAHACMEPMNATAWVKKDGIEIWAGTESQGPNQGILSHVGSVVTKQVKVNTMLLGGGFGRRFAPDFTIAATVLSKMSGKPVKLVYSREDDMRAYFYRPASVTRFAAGLDEGGKPVSFTARVASPSIMEASGFMKLPPDGVDSFAVAQSFGSYVAEVAEVSVDKDGRPKVHRVVAAVDCGEVVNPEIVKRQCESAIVYGLTAALYGRITFKGGQVEQGNFDTYPMLRMSEMPKVEVYIVKSKEHATGMGEPGLPALAPAVTAAIYKATGKRIRKLPIDPEALKA